MFFVEGSGKVYAFGDNTWGQLGLGHCRPVRKPVRIKGKYAHDCDKSVITACIMSYDCVSFFM